MLDQLEALATRIERLPAAVREELGRLVRDGGALLLDINRGYLEAGKLPDGQVIQPGGYSPAYAKFKAKYGKFKNTAYVDLKLTGEFLDSLELQDTAELQYLIVATDEKYAFLQKYGELLGINEADLDDFVRSILQPELDAFIGRYLD
ncbi:hypothetical protein [Hymenobacter guriensis]|uniref:Uncharacterized protein n=1 Tax=Hymenobacter guriensis TaxID=2793065 RepID=A0ABS0L7P3_9BACT|nr:hypothetical protein [Hymenobacter guriensis]MBG8556163.1 hypothetical protein [Hymenobacter guriensis]